MTPLIFEHLTGVSTNEETMIDNLFHEIKADKSGSWVNLARELHVRFVLLDNSLVPLGNATGQDRLHRILESSPEVGYVRSFGQVELYEIEQYIPIVYSPQRVSVLSTSLTGPRDQFASRTTAFINRSDVAETIFKKLSSVTEATVLSYERKDPVTFELRVRSSGPFVLVLGVPYSELWVARFTDKPVQNHIMINGFANAWFIEDSGLLSIRISYVGQEPVVYGWVVSGASILGMAVVLIKMYSRKEHRPFFRIYPFPNTACKAKTKSVVPCNFRTPHGHSNGDVCKQ
jgi:hypothetical protein